MLKTLNLYAASPNSGDFDDRAHSKQSRILRTTCLAVLIIACGIIRMAAIKR